MKKLLLAGMLFAVTAASAQKTPVKSGTPKTAAKPKTAPVKATNPLKNQTDSVSYAIGAMVASFYKQQGIKTMNAAMVSKAVMDIYASKAALLNETECNTTVMRALNPGLTNTVEESEKFLATNKNRPGVKISASGLQYEVIREGTGIKPTASDTVTVHYSGTLVNGTEFDNSYKRGEPISFPLGNVIPGWTEGLQYMSVGSKYKLYIPYQLGYGMNGQGPIPGGSTLIFEVELLKVNGKE